MSEPLGVEERARLRGLVGWDNQDARDELIAAAPALLDEVDRLTEALEAAEQDTCRRALWCRKAQSGWRALESRAERAEADLADEKRRHAGLRAGLADFYEHNADLVSEYWRIKVRALLDAATEETP